MIELSQIVLSSTKHPTQFFFVLISIVKNTHTHLYEVHVYVNNNDEQWYEFFFLSNT